MSNPSAESRRHRQAKALVLLSERRYLEENLREPVKYFPFLVNKGVLDSSQCSLIKQQPSVEFQVRKFLELVALKEEGYDVFVSALKLQKVHAHVASYLKRKVHSMLNKLSKPGESDLVSQALCNQSVIGWANPKCPDKTVSEL